MELIDRKDLEPGMIVSQRPIYRVTHRKYAENQYKTTNAKVYKNGTYIMEEIESKFELLGYEGIKKVTIKSSYILFTSFYGGTIYERVWIVSCGNEVRRRYSYIGARIAALNLYNKVNGTNYQWRASWAV